MSRKAAVTDAKRRARVASAAGLFLGACNLLSPTPNERDRAEPDAGLLDAAAGGSGGALGSGASGGTLVLDIDASGGTTTLPSDASDDGCTTIHQRAKVVERPMDIVFIIDNSGSMSEEIAQVKARINEDLAAILDASGIDYRVIMFTDYGTGGFEVCIQAPLGPGDCQQASTTIDNPPRFYHYDWNVQSWDSLCLLLSRWNATDAQGRPPWSSYLRVGSFKTFVQITDDGVRCTTPGGVTLNDVNASEGGAERTIRDFDAALRALSRDHFGPPGKRTYQWFSIVGIGPHDPPTEPWTPAEPLETTTCPTADSPGLSYQLLSKETGGLRWPVCQNDDFGSMFRAIATAVVERARLPCEWTLPPPPAGKVYDSGKLSLTFDDGSGSEVHLTRVENRDGCGEGWFLDDNDDPRVLSLCPASCEAIRADDDATLDIVVPCESIIDPPH